MNITDLHDKNLFYIGGVVRDELLEKESFDTDLTYVGDAIEFAKSLSDIEIVQINESFGTVKIRYKGCDIDIASTRSEIYPNKGHLPVVKEIGCNLEADILRRDFTINAMAKSTETGEIIDYVNGLQDLKCKNLKVLHDKSFIDDPTRIVRGLKFAIRFGFELEEETFRLQEEYLNNINYDMSYKRLKKELIETFNLNSQEAFNRFVNQRIYKLLTACDFELPNVNFEALIKKYKPNIIWLIYVGLLPEVGKLPLTKIEKRIVDDFYKLRDSDIEDEFAMFQMLRNSMLESVIMYSSINYGVVINFLENWQNISLSITGKDLLNIGLQPSPRFQECFDFVLMEKLKNPELEKFQEIELVKKYFRLI